MATSTALSTLQLACLPLTFGDAERVVAAGHKVVERHEQVAVIFAGSGQQVLLGVPAGRLGQALTLGVRFLKSFCARRRRERRVGRDQKALMRPWEFCFAAVPPTGHWGCDRQWVRRHIACRASSYDNTSKVWHWWFGFGNLDFFCTSLQPSHAAVAQRCHLLAHSHHNRSVVSQRAFLLLGVRATFKKIPFPPPFPPPRKQPNTGGMIQQHSSFSPSPLLPTRSAT